MRDIIKLTPKLSEKAKVELEEIEDKISGDMTNKEWEFFKTIRC